jgi:hypothetical protein
MFISDDEHPACEISLFKPVVYVNPADYNLEQTEQNGILYPSRSGCPNKICALHGSPEHYAIISSIRSTGGIIPKNGTATNERLTSKFWILITG